MGLACAQGLGATPTGCLHTGSPGSGVVVEERAVVNGQAEPGAAKGYILAGLTTFGRTPGD